jgi:flagellar motility protein MotE (MotC chaperone)
MKLLRSTWLAALVALLLGAALQNFVLLSKVDALIVAAAEAEARESLAAGAPPKRINWDFNSTEMDELRLELTNRLTAVRGREDELQEYEKRLKAERAEIEKIKREIETVRDELMNRLIEIAASEQKNLKTLAATYGEMEPAAALAIFQEMDDEMVVKILAFMKPDQVRPLLEQMAQTKDGDRTLASRAAAISYKLRLLNQVKPADNT